MERTEDFYLMGPGQVIGEVVSFIHMLGTLAMSILARQLDTPNEAPVLGFYLPGIMAPGGFYRGICHQLELSTQGRMRFEVPPIGRGFFDLNCHRARRARELLDEACSRESPKILIGHSWGGILDLMMVEKYPNLHVCAIAAPIRGTPYVPLQILARRVLGIDPEKLPEDLEALRSRLSMFGNRITTIAGKNDRVAPPDRCYIEGADNIVLEGGFSDLHTGLPSSRAGHLHTMRRARRALRPRLAVLPGPTAATA